MWQHSYFMRPLYASIITSCTKALVRAVETHYEPALQAMSKLPWATIENVGDHSEYVSMIQGTLKTCVGTIQVLITNKRYFRTFCDKLIECVTRVCWRLNWSESITTKSYPFLITVTSLGPSFRGLRLTSLDANQYLKLEQSKCFWTPKQSSHHC